MTNRQYWENRAKRAMKLSFENEELAQQYPELKKGKIHPYSRVARTYAMDAIHNYKLASQNAPTYNS